MKLHGDVWKGLWVSFLLTFWLRASVFVIGFVLVFLELIYPVPRVQIGMNFSENIPVPGSPWFLLVAPLQRFDALWYERIASAGYTNLPAATAFFPLYPWVVGFTGHMLSFTFAQSAFVLNTLFVFLLFFFLFLVTRKEYGTEAAIRTQILYAAFPVSFFLIAPYPEVLFLDFVLLAFLLASYRRFFASSLLAGLAAATKPYGVAIAIPMVYMIATMSRGKERIVKLISLLLIPLSFLLVVWYQDVSTHMAASTFKAQTYWGIKFAWPWTILEAEKQLLATYSYDLGNHLNIILFVIGFILLVLSWKRLKTQYWIYTAILFSIFVLTSFKYNGVPLFSFSRYFLTLFPFFMFAGSKKLQWYQSALYIMTSILLFVLLFTLYSTGIFVA